MQTRHKGEGSVYPRYRKNGDLWRYEASVEAGFTEKGTRRRKVVTGKTEADVARKLRVLQRQKEDNALHVGKSTLTDFLVNRWLPQAVAPQRKPRVYEKYEQDCRNHIIPAIGKVALCKLTKVHVQTMLNNLAKKLSYNTIRNIRATLRKALNQAIAWDELTSGNPAVGVELPRARAAEPIMPLDREQAQILLNAVAGHRFEVLFRISLSLGLRRGEVCGLRWMDIDLEKHTLRITGAVQRMKGLEKHSTVQRDTPKTLESARTLGIPPVLARLLARLRDDLATIREEIPTFNPDNYVFCSEVGTVLEPGKVTQAFNRILKSSGLPDTFRFHDLRHSCATLLIAQKVHLSVIRDILGHANIETTANIYGHVLKEVQHDALQNLDDLFDDPMTLELPRKKQVSRVQKGRVGAMADLMADRPNITYIAS